MIHKPYYKIDLLEKIHMLKECTIDELKAAYLPPKRPGVVLGISASFEDDLKTLCDLGAITIEEGKIKFIHWP